MPTLEVYHDVLPITDRITLRPEQEILHQLMQVRPEWPRNPNSKRLQRIAKYRDTLERLDYGLERLEFETGEDAYDSRFLAELVSIAMDASGLGPVFIDRKKAKKTIDFFARNVVDLSIIHNIWTQSANETGVITPPPFQDIALSLDPDKEIEKYRLRGNQPDVWSEPNRYPNLFREIRQRIPKGGTIVEFGAAKGDNLVKLASHFESALALDNLDLETIVQYINNTSSPATLLRKLIEVHKNKSGRFGFQKVDIFDDALGDSGMYERFPKPLVFLILNSIFPHYDYSRISMFLENLLAANPDYIVIGGGTTGLEQTNPDNPHKWTNRATARIFRYETKNVLKPTVALKSYVFARNKEEYEVWVQRRMQKRK